MTSLRRVVTQTELAHGTAAEMPSGTWTGAGGGVPGAVICSRVLRLLSTR